MTFNKPDRRQLLAGLATSALVLPAMPAFAQAYPARPVKVVVPFGAGGIGDVTTRIACERLGDKLGQRFVIENQPGPGGMTAARSVLAAEKDGYTLALFSNGTAISVGLFPNLTFDPMKDFVPISSIGYFDFVFANSAKAQDKTLGELIKRGQDKPGSLNVGTIAAGSTQNLSAELFKATTKLDFRIVPYRNTPDLVVALLRGDVDLAIDSYSAIKPNLEDKQIRALATSSAKRSQALPDVPTVAEAGVPGFDVTSWNALFAPAGTPPDVIKTINDGLAAVLADADLKKKMLDLGIEARVSTPQEISDRLKDDIAKWSSLIKTAGIQIK